ncbi:hypothetical protein ABFX02_06G157800 [Erythranthe guttata]
MDSDKDSYHDEYSYGDDVEEIDDSGSEAAEETDSGEEEEELAEYGGGRNSSRRRQKHYTILTEERIRQLQDNDISQVSSLLSVSKTLACTLLRRHNWSISAVSDKWFSDEEKVRLSLGLSPPQESLNPPPNNNDNNSLCNICFEEFNADNVMFSCTCGHPFCMDCWRSYVSISINNGPACLRLSCPEPKCKSDVGPDMIELLASEEDREKYNRYFFRSYVECHANMRWCPGDGCDRAVRIQSVERENYDVACDCSRGFCFKCMDECHRPADCETVRKWTKQNESEENNNKWLLSYTKPCPECGRKIEKNQGCNHITCRDPCKHEFCWLCLTPWKEAHYDCNRYEEDESLTNTRKKLKRYMHYYERWAANHKSREIAAGNLKWAKDELISVVAENNQQLPEDGVELVIEAFELITESRTALKWSYAYGYYVPWRANSAKLAFFLFLQGQAERVLETLHRCAERGVEKYSKTDFHLYEFRDFTDELRGLIELTRNHFGELVRALENNLSEVTEVKKPVEKPPAPSKRRTR